MLKLIEALDWQDMGETIEKIDGNIRCTGCGKLLAKKVGHRQHFEIKCSRCGTFNIYLDKMGQQIIVIDINGKILHINKITEDTTGYKLCEVVGKKPSDFWGGQMPEKFYEELWKNMKEKKHYQILLTNKKKTGELYQVRLSISPILDPHGKTIFYLGVEEEDEYVA